jgi:hypothetical protein
VTAVHGKASLLDGFRFLAQGTPSTVCGIAVCATRSPNCPLNTESKRNTSHPLLAISAASFIRSFAVNCAPCCLGAVVLGCMLTVANDVLWSFECQESHMDVTCLVCTRVMLRGCILCVLVLWYRCNTVQAAATGLSAAMALGQRRGWQVLSHRHVSCCDEAASIFFRTVKSQSDALLLWQLALWHASRAWTCSCVHVRLARFVRSS